MRALLLVLLLVAPAFGQFRVGDRLFLSAATVPNSSASPFATYHIEAWVQVDLVFTAGVASSRGMSRRQTSLGNTSVPFTLRVYEEEDANFRPKLSLQFDDGPELFITYRLDPVNGIILWQEASSTVRDISGNEIPTWSVDIAGMLVPGVTVALGDVDLEVVAVPTVRDSGFAPVGLEEQSRDWNVNNWLADMWGSDRSGVERNDPSLRALVKAFLEIPAEDPPEPGPFEPIDVLTPGEVPDLADVVGETPLVSAGAAAGLYPAPALSFSTSNNTLQSIGGTVTIPGINYSISIPAINTSSFAGTLQTLILACAGLAMGWRVFEELRRM